MSTSSNEDRSAPGADRSRDHPVLEAADLSKQFPGVRALDHVSFSIAPGEIVALLGQNGAGKSTLIQIFAGAHAAGSYTGTVSFAGQPFAPLNVADAEAVGVALVPQEVNIVPDLTVAENITLNDEPTRWGVLDIGERQRRARAALAGFSLDFDPDLPMSSLDLASQQLVVIARALAKKARLLILDEPTAALTESESLQLFERMRALKSAGVAIIFVSHRLAEVFAISDRIVVMRDGRIRGRHRHQRRLAPGDRRRDGRRDGRRRRQARAIAAALGETMLEVRGLGVFEPEGKMRVSGLDLAVRKGEVVGLFGLLGAGCIEAALAIYGAYPGRREGTILVDGAEVAIDSPDQAVALGFGLMAQDRRDCLIGDQSVADNIGIASLDKVAAQRRRRSGRMAAAGASTRSTACTSRQRRSTPRCRRCRAAISRRCRSAAGWRPTPASSS